LSFSFVSRLLLVLLLLAALAAVDAYLVEPRLLVTERVAVSIPSLPEDLVGFKIGVLSDLHLGLTPADRVRRAVQALLAMEPDVVVVVGDFTGGDAGTYGTSQSGGGSDLHEPKSSEECMDDIDYALESLKTAAKTAYGVPGNWDRWLEGGLGSELESITMLINGGVLVAPNLWLCGADDVLLGSPDIHRAIADAPNGAIKILLAHEPEVADSVTPEHGISLQISGHSHGGQVRIPGVGPVFLPPMGERYDMGLYETPTHKVYTTRGIGMSHIPVRFMCPPEITLITLVAGS
jgi:predicted MPP superfamily phosphohydrolase